MNSIEIRAIKSTVHAFESAAEFAAKSGFDYSAVSSAIARLESEGLVEARRSERQYLKLTAEGRVCLDEGAPEHRLALAVKALGGKATLQEAASKAAIGAPLVPVALQWGIRRKLFAAGKGSGGATAITFISEGTDEARNAVRQADSNKPLSPQEQALLVSRKLAAVETEKAVEFKATARGIASLDSDAGENVSRLTPQMLKDGSWRQVRFKQYDLNTVVAPVRTARKHAYKEFISRIKSHLAGMGFAEAHGPLVELEFWNMDALFMAQDHPSREIHEAFKVRGRGAVDDVKLVNSVRQAHETGLAGSRGWRYEWSPEVALQMVLRSQTTAVSARHLARGITPPARLFCIGRVFRPDEIDWKHFIEFNQCEGIVVDDSMNFRELLGYLKSFAVEVFGARETKFIPHYYPFTEPSVDLAVKIEGRGWMEVGGAGMFRPEMLAALGVKCPVLAWGLGIDRLALMKLGITDIRDLFSSDLELLSNK